MITPVPKSARALVLLGVAGVALSAALAFADCNRTVHAADSVAPSSSPVHSEVGVSMSDPGLDGMFARYADLHRDAVGYALVDVVESPVYANAVPASPSPLAR